MEFWACPSLLLAKEAREKQSFSRHGARFLFSLLMKYGRQGVHLTSMCPRFEVGNVILKCRNLRKHDNLVCSP